MKPICVLLWFSAAPPLCRGLPEIDASLVRRLNDQLNNEFVAPAILRNSSSEKQESFRYMDALREVRTKARNAIYDSYGAVSEAEMQDLLKETFPHLQDVLDFVKSFGSLGRFGDANRYDDLQWWHLDNTTGQVVPFRFLDQFFQEVWEDVMPIMEHCSRGVSDDIPSRVLALPAGGSLIGLLRYGRLMGHLGVPDAVEQDIDIAVFIPHETFEHTWRRFQDCVLFNVRNRAFVGDLEGDNPFLIALGGWGWTSILSQLFIDLKVWKVDAAAEKAVCVLGTCRWGSVLDMDWVHPLHVCKAYNSSVLCPRNPFEYLQITAQKNHDAGVSSAFLQAYQHSSLALPKLTTERDLSVDANLLMMQQGISFEFACRLRETALALSRDGYQSMSSVFPADMSQLSFGNGRGDVDFRKSKQWVADAKKALITQGDLMQIYEHRFFLVAAVYLAETGLDTERWPFTESIPPHGVPIDDVRHLKRVVASMRLDLQTRTVNGFGFSDMILTSLPAMVHNSMLAVVDFAAGTGEAVLWSSPSFRGIMCISIFYHHLHENRCEAESGSESVFSRYSSQCEEAFASPYPSCWFATWECRAHGIVHYFQHLVRGLCENDPQRAFHKFIVDFGPSVFGFCRDQVGCTIERSDVVAWLAQMSDEEQEEGPAWKFISYVMDVAWDERNRATEAMTGPSLWDEEVISRSTK